jgi:type I restriction enzyme S subunit
MRTVRIADICRTYSGGTPDRLRPEYFGGGIPWVKSGEVVGVVTKTEETLTPAGLESCSAKWVEPGALLMAMYGAGLTAGQVARLAIRATTNQAVLAIVPNEPAEAEYLAHALVAAVPTLLRRKQGSGQPNLNADIVRRVRVPWPAVGLRRWVEAAMRSLDAVAENLAQLVSAKRAFKRGLMQQLLLGQTRFPEFRDSPWVKTTIGALFAEVQRRVTWNEDQTFTLVSVRRRSGGLFLRERKKGAEIKVKSLYAIREADILISTRQIVHGAIARVPAQFDGAHVSGEYLTLVPRDGAAISTKYFDYLSQLPRMYHASFLASYGVDIEKLTFNPEWYLETAIHLPGSVDEQDRIVACLETCDRELGLLTTQQGQIDIYRHVLLSRLLSGHLALSSA